MALVITVIVIAWTLLVIRLFGIGATLSERTLVTYLALGALMALTAAPLAEKIIVPYPLAEYQFRFWASFLPMTVRNLVLLAPVGVYAFMSGNYRRLSCADVFLLAFAVGFGYEIVAPLLASGVASERLHGLTLLPPWQFTWHSEQRFLVFGFYGVAVAGVGYSIGLAAMTTAALLRFSANLKLSLAAGAAVLLITTMYDALVTSHALWGGGLNAPQQGVAWLYSWLLLNGKLVAPLALAALVYCTMRELSWCQRASATPTTGGAMLLTQLRALFTSLQDAGWRAGLHRLNELGLERRIDLLKAELSRTPADRELLQSLRLSEIESTRAAAAPAPIAILDLRLWQAAWAGLVMIAVLFPWLPDWLDSYLWIFPLLHFSLPILPLTFIQALLVLAILRWFLRCRAQAGATWDADESCLVHGQSAIGYAAMGAALLVLFQVPIKENFYPPYSALTTLGRAALPTFDPGRLAVLVLLLGLGTFGLGLSRVAAWQRGATAGERRSALIRRWIILANAAILFWISLGLYVPMLTILQNSLGPMSFTLFGRFGNVMVALLTIVIAFGISFAVGYGLRWVSQRVEAFLVNEKPDQSGVAGAGGGK